MAKMVKVEGSIKDTGKPLPPSASGANKKDTKKQTPKPKKK